MDRHLQNLMCPKSNTEATEVMFRTNPRKYWRQYINALEDEIIVFEEQLKEKDAMIDWLTEKLVSNHIYFDYIKHFSVKGYTIEANKIVNDAGHCQLWRKAAQEAVKKNAGR